MPRATAGQEFASNSSYSYKVDASVKEVQDYYTSELDKLGWSSYLNMPSDQNGSIQVFQKDGSILTVTIMETDGSVVVMLTTSS